MRCVSILVVDDQQTIRELYEAVATQGGLNATGVAAGRASARGPRPETDRHSAPGS